MGKILVALSGGVDSAAAVLLLREQGYDVVGVTFDMTGDEEFMSQACRTAQELDVEHTVVDVREQFKKMVVEYFVESYRRGQTPAPCTVCNAEIKWKLLEQTADKLRIKHIATGHYCKIVRHNEHYYVERGEDPKKDQSYYLWALTQSQLARAVTPMGYHTKEGIKAFMRERGYSYIADKQESMSVCFLKGGDYRDFLRQHGVGEVSGVVTDVGGRVIGSHCGVPFYTVGQKRDLSLESGHEDWRVVGIDAATNRLVAGAKDQLFTNKFRVQKTQFADFKEVVESDKVTVMVRGFGENPQGFSKITVVGDGVVEVVTESPAWAMAAGQPVVFYIENRVVGGGFFVP